MKDLGQEAEVSGDSVTQITVLQLLHVAPEQPLGRLEAEDVEVGLELLVLTQPLGGRGPGDTVVRDLALHQPHEARRGQLQQLSPHPVGLGVGHDPSSAPRLVHKTRN